MADTLQRLDLEPAVWKEPVRGGYPDPRLFALSGLEQLRSYFRGMSLPPPLAHLTGLFFTEVDEGTATFTMPANPWLVSPPGYIQLGVLAILADSSLGCAIQTTLPPATPYTTSELSLSFLRPVVPDGGTIVARGRVIHSGRSLALSDVEIADEQGRLLAHGTSRCFVLDRLETTLDPGEAQPTEIPVHETPDPFLRPVAGRPLTQDEWDSMTGLEIMRGLISGALPAPPLSHLTGLLPTDADEGRVTFVLPASGWLTSPIGTVQGGATALLADTVLGCAVQTTLPTRTAYSPLDLKVSYLRPVFADGRDLIGTATVAHRGRSLAVANAELRNPDGKLVALAMSNTLIREGHGWQPDEPELEAR